MSQTPYDAWRTADPWDGEKDGPVLARCSDCDWEQEFWAIEDVPGHALGQLSCPDCGEALSIEEVADVHDD